MFEGRAELCAIGWYGVTRMSRLQLYGMVDIISRKSEMKQKKESAGKHESRQVPHTHTPTQSLRFKPTRSLPHFSGLLGRVIWGGFD